MSALLLTSKDFDNDGKIPKKFGYKQENKSPSLSISGVPSKTASLALIMDDPDAKAAVGKIWVHWVLWNIDPKTNQVAENSKPSGSIEGKNDFNELGYGGPAPPDKEHTYIFKLYALDKKLALEKGATKNALEDAMKNHIIEQSILKGKFSPN